MLDEATIEKMSNYATDFVKNAKETLRVNLLNMVDEETKKSFHVFENGLAFQNQWIKDTFGDQAVLRFRFGRVASPELVGRVEDENGRQSEILFNFYGVDYESFAVKVYHLLPQSHVPKPHYFVCSGIHGKPLTIAAVNKLKTLLGDLEPFVIEEAQKYVKDYASWRFLNSHYIERGYDTDSWREAKRLAHEETKRS